jgi:predicted O-methyltransferase YrrM
MRNPAYALRAALRELTWADERFLGSISGCTSGAIRQFLDEPFADVAFVTHLRRCEPGLAGTVHSADLYAKKVLLQYAVVRALRPAIVLETGVAHGVSTAYLLLALTKNACGHLHSIDRPDPSFLPARRAPGWLVPEQLRGRWSLQTGNAEELLPALLKQVGAVDLFIHDSLHTYEHMMFEFETVYPALRDGGLLLADDALWNRAFDDFAGAVHPKAARILRGVGVLQK